MKKFSLLLVFKCISISLAAQQFMNGGLESTSRIFECDGWQNVPYDDPVCEADVSGRDSPDITNQDRPGTFSSIDGDPHSGKTFVSGVRSINPGDDFQEGIMQQVDSLVPGHAYRITFWQAVVKQENLRDKTGSWAVYIDSVLAGVSKISNSDLAYDRIALDWDERSIDFVATSDRHWIKFLPMDNDSDVYSGTDDYAGLRMGIDDISLSCISKIKVEFNCSPVAGVIIVDNQSGEKTELRVLSADGISVINTQTIAKNRSRVDLSGLPAGKYTLEFILGKEFSRFEFAR